MYITKTNKEFFNQFQLLAVRIKELSCLFQYNFTEVSSEEVNEWNVIASKLQNDLSKLIEEGNNRFILMK